MLKTLNAGDLTPKEEIERRIAGLRKGMAKSGLAFAVIVQNVDLFYLTGSVQKGVFVLPVEGDPIFFVERNVERALYESPLEVTPIGKDKEVAEILRDRRILKGTGGMEFDVLPVAVFDRWRGLFRHDDFRDISPVLRELRLVKSPFELAQVKRSGEICSHVFEKAPEAIREGAREVDIAAYLEGEGRKTGHQGFLRMRGLNQEMMNIYITHGYSGTLHSGGDVPISGVGVTHAIAQGPSVNRVERDVPLLIDYGGGYNGYITDETRVYVVGKLREEFVKAYEAAREIVEDTSVFGREGVNGADIFLRAQHRVKKAGLEEFFMGYGPGKVSFIGHGLGLEINELPVITPRHNIILQEGMVFAFEPKFIMPGLGAVGIEVDFIVRPDKLERVTDTPVGIVYL